MTRIRYSRSAIALHWAIAVLLVFQMGLGWHMTSMPQGAVMFSAFQFHKSVGMLVLVLSIARVAVRLFAPRPADVASGPAATLFVQAVHAVLYGVMIAGPITGWMIVSSAKVGIPTVLFGMLPLPHLPLGQAWHGLAEQGHELLSLIGAGLIAVHLAGAIRHHLILGNAEAGEREDVIGRMIPFAARKSADGWKIACAVGAAAVLIAGFGLPWLVYAVPDLQVASRQTGSVGMALVSPEPSSSIAEASPAAEPSEAANPKAGIDKDDTSPVIWQIEGGGRLGFTATMNGAAISGRFDRWSADILFDPKALDDSSITIRVPLLSANTGDTSRDEMLKGPSFFGSAGANAVFRSSAIRHLTGSAYSSSGTLTMNGKSRPITLTFDLDINDNKAKVSGNSRIDRLAFGIGSGEWASTEQIAAQVGVNFVFSARRAD